MSYFGRQHEGAIELLTRSARAVPGLYLPRFLLGLCHVNLGRLDEALRVLEQGRAALPDNGDILAALAYAYGMAQQRQRAQETLDELRRLDAQQYVSPFVSAYPFVGLGDHDQAMAQLERAFATRDWQLVTMKVDPVLDPVRSDPRVQDIQRRMNLPD